MEGISDTGLLALIGCAGGIVLGLAARLGRFCTLGAIEDCLYQNDTTRIRMWVLAIGCAGLICTGLIAAGALIPQDTLYHVAPFSPVASILGGLMFGYGMALAGSCGFGALARTGGGDLRAFVIVLVMGISAYVAISGPLAATRIQLIEGTQIDTALRSYPDLLAQATAQPSVVFGFGFSVVLLLGALASRTFRNRRLAIFWGAAVGMAVAAGWAGTQWVITHGFRPEPVSSYTFTAPLGETLIYLMTSSGGGLSFGVGSVAGVLIGACAGSLIKGHFRWEACEDPRELKRQCIGAVFMGLGGVLALGCTIGQGISAFALFTFGAPLTFASIFLGAAIGLRQLITGFALPS